MGCDFQGIVGAAHVGPGDERLDGVPVDAVVRPGSGEEVAACLRRAAESGVALVARGGGSKLHWGNPVRAPRVTLLDLGRLTEPLDLQPLEGIATLGAGWSVAELVGRLDALGQRSRLDPLHPRASVGGVIAADPIGPEHALGRRLRDDLLGLRVALPNGQLTHCGGRVVKNVSGFDLTRLYCGSLGTLGVITQATLRLRAAPAERRLLRRELSTLDLALQTGAALVASGVVLAGAAVRPGARGAELLWLLEGHPQALERASARFPGEPAPLQGWQQLRQELAEPGDPRHGAVLRIASRPSEAASICRELTSRAGSGTVRVALPETGVVFARLDETGVPPLLEAAGRRGWAVFVERASEGLRGRVDAFGPPPDALPLMRALKQRFDPHGCLAPGRFAGRI